MKTKKIVIIQTGQAIETARNKYGDFDKWFIRGMAIDGCKTKTYRVFEQLVFPEKNAIAGIIITGSSAMVTEKAAWSEATINWLKQFVSARIPIMGVCYGHQLLAKLLGGKVDWNPKGRELGKVTLQFTKDMQTDILFKQIINEQTQSAAFLASHQQSVKMLPKKATLLGTTNLDNNHCFRYNKHIWGLQFHPEFTIEIIKDYINARGEDIVAEGLNPEKMINKLSDTQNGSKLLQTFAQYCLNN
jgi:GMP synthase (glutamine-hydrolysing)